jgi:DegV family protein with EDD domain
MARIALVTDSSATLSPALIQQYGIHVMPLYIHFGTEVLRDGQDMTPDEFIDRLQRSSTLPTTSQPSAGDFLEVYRNLFQGADAIISIHISTGLSGTVASALGARQMLVDEAAERGVEPPVIHVVDSTVVSVGLELLVTAAARAIEAGESVETVLRIVQNLIAHIRVIFLVDTLEYLHKGGRIGGASALLGSVLQVKPILHFADGRIDVLERVRTAKKAKQRLLAIIEEEAGRDATLHAAITHVSAPGEAQRFRQEMTGCFDCQELFISDLSPAVSVHVGPGAVGIGFYSQA